MTLHVFRGGVPVEVGSAVVTPTETPDVLDWIQAYVKRTGFAPNQDMIYGAANFRQEGGIGRLLTALERYALELARKSA